MTEQEKTIIQLADNIHWLKKHLKNKRELTPFEAACLDWESIVKDDHLKKVIKRIQNI